MQSCRGVSNQHVAGSYPIAVQRIPFGNDAENGTRQIVVTGLVEVRHFRDFTTRQRHVVRPTAAGHTLDDGCDSVGIDRGHGNVVEERNGPRCVNEDIVDTVIDEILPDGIVPIRASRDQHFGPHTVGARHQDGVADVWRHADHSAKTTHFPPRQAGAG